MSRAREITPSRAFGEWLHEHIRRDGFLLTLRDLGKLIYDFVLESTPERRRRRYGDVDYDWEHRVDTTSATVGWRDRLMGLFLSPYQATDAALFHEMMSALSIDFGAFTFVDVGSGKGRVLLMASDYPFQRVIGIERLAALHRVAQENIQKYQSESQKCFNLESICADAASFQLPPVPLVIYLFNPLPESALRQFVSNLDRSLTEHSRPVYVIYHNPLLEQVVADSTSLLTLRAGEQYSIFAAGQSADRTSS